ncbi:MAG: hypothetical protein FP813_08995 [Desulfurivibrio sp.]|nr:hypothetical protein [Desulfurivibrio sp.]MBU3936704.1 hypothetical protein [Pseudomonadota bacterium]MBU4119372.1 hypothetical protein [Pseudomonadota bacterium]
MPTLDQRLADIKLLMRYAVPPNDLTKAAALVEKHSTDSVALHIFHAFYSYLPEGLEDAITVLRLLDRRQGAFLICASTGLADYLYLVTSEQAEFLGPLSEGIWEDEVLAFFNLENREAFLKKYADLTAFPVYVPAHLHNDLCPFCHVADGEIHTLGCPVEICPWCGGQLTSCGCRFTLLGKTALKNESQLEELLALLNKKGRLPFSAEEHRPAYPITPEDLQ